MNSKQKLGYMVVGGALVAVGMTVAVLLVSPVTAQNDKHDTIQCSQLEVVDADGDVGIVLSMDAHGGRVDVLGKDDISKVVLDITEQGGTIALRDKDGRLGVSLFNGEYGGRVHAYGKQSNGAAVMSINEYGGGDVATWDKNGYRKNRLK